MATKCKGKYTASCRIDGEVDEFVTEEAERVAGGSRSEYLRRLIRLARESKNGELRCPECNTLIIIDLRE
jgi:Arc/MetJ-type ribon-helix-helix transcriptional regulator